MLIILYIYIYIYIYTYESPGCGSTPASLGQAAAAPDGQAQLALEPEVLCPAGPAYVVSQGARRPAVLLTHLHIDWTVLVISYYNVLKLN